MEVEMAAVVWLDPEKLEWVASRILSPDTEERKQWQGKSGGKKKS